MNGWRKQVLSIIAGILLWGAILNNGSIFGQTGANEPESNLLEITHGGQEQVLSEVEEDEPGAVTAGSLTGAEEPDAQYVFPMMRLHILVPSDIEGCEPGVYPVHLDVPEGVLLLDEAGETMLDDRDFAGETSVLVKATQPSQQIGDIEITAHSEECPGLGYDRVRATALVVDLDAHWPGTMSAPGPLIDDVDEVDSLNLIASVNDDDDNDDDILDNDHTQFPAITPEDDDIMTFVVRALTANPGTGTLELFAGDGLHFYTADGAQELALPLLVDLANPSGSLADAVKAENPQDVTLLVESNIPVERTMVELVYSQDGTELARDEAHLKVVYPTVKGGFHRGSVKYSEAMQLGADWVVCREFDETHPLSVFLLADPVYQSMQYKRQEEATYTREGWRVGLLYFEQLATRWNVFLDAVPFVPKYEAEMLLKQFCEATGVPEDIARTEGFVTDPDDPITESGIYDIRLCPTDQNKYLFKNIRVKVIKPGQIDGWFRIIGDVNAPYFHEEALTEVPEEDEIFFRTLGGMRLHLNVELSNELKQYEHYLIGYEWFVAQDAEFTFTEASFEALNTELEDNGVPEGLRNRLEDLLENESFSTENDLMVAIQPAFEGYTITEQVLQAFQKYVDEHRFPDYFLKDTGFTGAVFVDDQGEEHELLNYTFEDADTLITALRNARVDGKPHKYAVHGYRVTKQALYFLKQDLPVHIYQKLSRLEKNTTFCDDDVPDACIRGKAGEGYSFRNVDDTGEFQQFITALNKALDREGLTPEQYEIIKIHTDHIEQFGPIIQSYAGHWRYYQLCRDAIVKHGMIKPGRLFPDYRTTLDDFTITDYALERLKDVGMPENLINTIENNLNNQEFATEQVFLDAVKNIIGEEPTNTYKEDLLNYAKEAPPLTGVELKETRNSVETPIKRQDVYWQGESQPDLNEMVTFSVILGQKKDLGEFNVIGTVPITRQIKSRVLQLEGPPRMTGDDVSMLQAVLRSMGQSQEAGRPGYRGTPVEIDPIHGFGSGTNRAINRLRYHDEIGKIGIADPVEKDQARRNDLIQNVGTVVDNEVLAKLVEHWNDYLGAFEAYPTFPFIRPPKNPTDPLHNQYDQMIWDEYTDNWLLTGAAKLGETYTDEFVSQVQNCYTPETCRDARKNLLDAWIKKEAETGHWGYKIRIAEHVPFSIVLGGWDERGSIGFSQVQSRHKYGNDTATGVFQEVNLYHPSDGICGFAIFSNHRDLYHSGGGGFYYAFQVSDASPRSSHKSKLYPVDPVIMYPRLAPLHLQDNSYTDEAADRLSKGIFAYNRGNRSELRAMIWPEMLRQLHPDYQSADYTGAEGAIKGIAYALDVKDVANLLENAQGDPLRIWTWKVRVITTGPDGVCQTAKEGDDEQVLNVNTANLNVQNQPIAYSVAIIGGLPLTQSNEILDTTVKVCFSEPEYTNFLNQHGLVKEKIDPFTLPGDNNVCFDLNNISNEAQAVLGEAGVNDLRTHNDDQIEVVEFEYSEEDWHNGISWIEKLQQAKGGV